MRRNVGSLLPEDEIKERFAALRRTKEIDEPEYKYVRPFSTTYSEVLDGLQSTDHRFRLGIGPIDMLTRGFGPKELVYFTGFSHSGKTQLVNTAILNNIDKRILFFSMDDPAEMILLKLTCMYAGLPADELERLIHSGDEAATATLKRAACEIFKNLIVVDDSLGISAMDQAIEEATRLWGAAPELVILDYLELMQGDSVSDDANANVKRKSQSLKKWVKDKLWPTIVVHQATRSGGAPGQPISMTSMAYGGEAEGTIVIGVRRKRDNKDLDAWERQQHKDTVTIHVVKNKRPPAKVTKPDGIDLYLDPETGLIRAARPGDSVAPTVEKAKPTTTLAQLERTVEEAEQRVQDFV